MSIIVRLFRAFILPVSTFSMVAIPLVSFPTERSAIANAQTIPVIPQQRTTPVIPQQRTIPVIPQQRTTQRICSLDPVEDLLPPLPSKSSNSLLSYLAEQGFTQNQEGSWVCYANDPKKEGRYFTLFKVQEMNGRLIGSSFLDEGSLIEGQDNRSLDLFMMLIERHMNASQENRQGIRRYLQAFISLVEQGKIKPTRRGFLFDQPNRGLVLYHTLSSGSLKGTAITVNIYLPKSKT